MPVKPCVDSHFDYTDPQEIYPESGDPTYRFDGKVLLAVSAATVSAAETLVMAMAQLPQTILLGRNASGAFCTPMSRFLSKGWQFEIPSEVGDGVNSERFGLQPDIFSRSRAASPVGTSSGCRAGSTS
jgi:C-terminal processing protease CtpA/Prc